MRRYAQETSVPVSKSRGEIDSLLRTWGCDGIQWTDDFAHDRVQLRFIFARLVNGDAMRFMARFTVALEPLEKVKARCIDGRSGRPSESKLADAIERRGRSEHRLLLLWLKAAFNAVDAGLVSPEALFLPFLEGRDGATVAERAIPQLSTLLKGSADRLLLGDGR